MKYYNKLFCRNLIGGSFGLDCNDILDPFYNRILIFRIWFVLQRWNNFSFRPFMTNMQAELDVKINRWER